MFAVNVIVFCCGILLILSAKQISTDQCDITKGDCVADNEKEENNCNKSICFRKPESCNDHKGVDLFGKDQRYQCNCKYLSDCQFQILSKCKNGCLPGFKKPYCQKRKYHEFITNQSITDSYLFSSDNKQVKKPRFVIRFRNTYKYRFSTVEIYSNFTDSTMKVSFPHKMECKLKPNTNRTICTGDVKGAALDINGKAGVYHIKLFGCPPQLYGKDCINECHCSRAEYCHQITGKCKRGCEDGWYGEKCAKKTYVNIARGQTTNQTSTYGIKGTTVFHNGTCENMNISMASDKAVDGNFDPGITHKSCASTDWEKDPYWQVMFDKPYTISQLRIYNRMGNNRRRLRGFKVYVGSSLCFQSRGYEYNEDVIHVKCRNPLTANSVRISLNGDGRMLTLCEVEVLQCVPGFYGDMCKKRCEHCEGSKCDQVTGRCEEGCIIGYYVPLRYQKCKECSSGYFGRNCTKKCHCHATCNHINGSCSGLCEAGYTGYNCQEECEVGRFGRNCKRTCHCIDNESCNRVNGSCEGGCSDGYLGFDCQEECPNGSFGHGCKEDCHCSLPCNHANGSCPGDCDAGYNGSRCQEECEGDKFGVNCKDICHCVDNENCDRRNGTCPDGCAAGYEGDNCQQECSNDRFGLGCNVLCRCSETCNNINGSCPGTCDEGYHGFNCQKEKSAQSTLVFVLVPLLLFILLIIGLVTAIWYWKFRGKIPIAKRDQKIRKIPENKYAGAIPEDTAHLCEEIQLNETESIYVNIANTSFKSNLQKYVSEKKQEVEPFNDEFLRLPKTLPLPYTEATKPENTKKNRYKTILPYDHSRVRLQPDEISSSDYINANFISNQRYIACQGPTQNTVTDFWRMVWQLKCNTIVMLTDIVENGKMKCIQYWPDEESIESFGTIKVTHINTRSHATYIHRSFTISKSGGHQNERWTIDHFFFSKWPDHGIPQYTEDILEFRNTVRFREGTTSSLVVHCSAGVGRTGTYICIDILLNEMLSGEAIDVLACVTKLREERMHMVQKRIQLEFIYDVLVENILTGDYDIDVNNIPREFSRITETDHSTRVSILEHQFQDVIKQVEVRDTNLALKEGEIEGEYANLNMSGVFIDGSSCEKEFLLTKSPKRNGALEFLMCMRKRGYLNIVAFDSSEETPTYLPRTLNETVKIGPYLLELINVEDKDVCIHSVLKVECDNKSRIEEFEINHFQVTIWADGNYPSSAEILKLSDILSAHQNEQFNKKIAVHCSDKFHKSGLLCIIHILKDAITSQSVINIVRLVRLIKKIEPNIIPDCESYAFIWKVAEYIQNESSLYSNFVQ
ncbi:receptor-type tyrosine-protein phosphatase T-like isoform X8 [Octopus vulgaris]|uniref:protein-tyrosine-phosphatase n=1 Tax=Octopus vulgaris TaxID=6645 RepID=A0AA36FCP9_OCTVU|nr:receptor-type tyrosine-protein phosphatase T-like isoform X8 [Octopus vulgaris]